MGDAATSAAPESYRYLNRPHSANAVDVCTGAAPVIVELPDSADNVKEPLVYLTQEAATNQMHGLFSFLDGYYRHLSAEKLCLIIRDPFLHHMKSSVCDLMSQYAVCHHSCRIALSPVGMFVPEFSQRRIIPDSYIGSLSESPLKVMIPLIASLASFYLVGRLRDPRHQTAVRCKLPDAVEPADISYRNRSSSQAHTVPQEGSKEA